MKVTVFGATGGIGTEIVRQALDAGHKVAAVVRDPARLGVRHPALEIVRVAELDNPEPLVPALDGADAAISGVGPRRRSDAGIAARATGGILRALDIAQVRRFVAVSAAPVGPVPAGDSWVNRRILFPLVGALLRDVYADLARMEEEIRRSGADWTVVRPPRLVSGPLTGTYRTAIGGNVPRGMTVRRADVAHLMLAALDDPSMVRQAVGVAR